MNRKIIYALILIALTVVVLLLTKGTTDVNLLYDVVSARTSMVLLCSVGLGVVIGLLLK